ncbi:unnamed protein product [Caenorhabditis nigoni]
MSRTTDATPLQAATSSSCYGWCTPSSPNQWNPLYGHRLCANSPNADASKILNQCPHSINKLSIIVDMLRKCYKRIENRQYHETSEPKDQSKGSPTMDTLMPDPTADARG